MNEIERARQAAEQILREKRITSVPVDVEGLAKEEGISLVYEELAERASGMMIKDDVGVTIGINSLHPESRQRFTIAHELAHYYLHSSSPTVYIDDASIAVDRRSEGQYIYEDAANAFASSLLMPTDALIADLDGRPVDLLDYTRFNELATQYGVMPQALAVRLIELGLLAGAAASSNEDEVKDRPTRFEREKDLPVSRIKTRGDK